MKRFISILPLLVCLVGGWIVVSAVMESREKEQTTSSLEDEPSIAVVPEAKTYSTQDQDLVQEVFSSPETLDSHSITISQNTPPHVENPQLLQSLQFTGSENKQDKTEAKGIEVASPLVESFVSLRTDAIRNPDSEQNQATVKSIMKKRQRRVAQLGMD